MTDLLSIWVEEAVTHNQRMMDKARTAYDLLKNKETTYAKALLTAAEAYGECVTVWQRIPCEIDAAIRAGR